MRKLIRSIPVVAILFLTLAASINARAQAPALNGYSAAVLNANPLGYWPLTETVAPPAAPPVAVNLGSLGATGNGQYLGGAFPGQMGALTNSGNTDTSVGFDRSTGEVVVPYSSALTQGGNLGITNSFTAECWIYPVFTNTTAEYMLGYGNMGNTSANPPTGYTGFVLEMTGARLEVKLYNTNTTTASVTLETSSAASSLLLQSNWYHVAVVFSNTLSSAAGGTNLFIFTNGVLATSAAVTTANTLGYTFVPDDGTGQAGTYIGTTFTVGCEPNQEGFFQGNIGEVALYPTALSPAVLFSHYTNGSSAVTPPQTYASLVLASSPLIYLPLNEKGAGYAYPVATNYATTGSAGNGFYLQGTSPGGSTGPTALGSPSAVTFPPSTQRTAYQLTETGRALTVGANVDIAPLNDLLLNINTNFVAGTANTNTTVLAWVKVPTGPVPWFQRIMGRNDGSSWRMNVNQAYFSVTNGFPGYPDFVDGGPDTVGATAVNDGNWHFWAATYNPTNFTESLYIDGVLVANSFINSLPSYANTSPLTIGAGATSTGDDGGNFANGSVCGVAVYNSALSAAQIDAIFGSAYGGIITQPPATVSYASGPVTLSAAVQGTFIQWYTGSPTGANTAVATGSSGEISGANTETLTLNPPASGDFTTYFVIVGNGTTLANSTLMATSSVVTLSKLAISGSYVTAVQALNPVGFWPLNEASGAVAYNWGTLGSQANGVYTADPGGFTSYTQLGTPGPSYSTLPSTSALQFGSTQGSDMLGGAGVFIPNIPGLQLGGSNSIAGVPLPVSVGEWVQVIGTPSWFQSVTGKGDDSFRTDEEEPTAGFNAHTSSDLKSPSSLADGNWHYWVGTWNGSNQQVLYIDGYAVSTNAVTPTTGGNTHQFFIGGAPDYVNRNFHGNVADVEVFNYSLSGSQVAQLWDSLFNSTVTVPATADYVLGTPSATITAQAQAPYMQWYSGTPGVGTPVPVFNGSGISGAGTTLGSATPFLTFTASGAPPALPTADYGSYFLVIGNGSGTFVTSSVVVLGSLSATSPYATAVLALNPIAYLPLNETVGATAYNYASNGYAFNGIYSSVVNCPLLQGVAGPPVVGMGTNNFGTQFSTQGSRDGTDTQTGVVIKNTALDITSNVTVTMWVQQPVGASYGIQEVYGQQDSTLIRFTVFGTGNAQMDFVDGSPDIIGGPQLNDGQWHFWTGTYNATNKAIVGYLDGVVNFTGTGTGNGSSTEPTVIGSPPDDTGRNFIGSVCQVATFTNVLTAAQVAALYNAAEIPPFFTVNPPAVAAANAGSALTIGNVTSSGSTPITNTWYFGARGSGALITTGGRFTATSSNLVISPVLASDAGSYYVSAANAFGTTNSAVTVLTVNSTGADQIYAGQSPTFTAAPGAASYQWNSNGVALAGATSSTFTLTNVTVASSPIKVYAVLNGTQFGVTNTVTVLAAPTDPYPVAVLGDHPIAYFRLNEPDNGLGNNGTTAHDYVNGYNGLYQNDGTPSDLVLGVAGFPYGLPIPTNTDSAASFGILGTGAVDNTPPGPSNNFAGFIPTIDFSTAVSNSVSYAPAEFSVEAWVYAAEGQHNGGIVTKGYGLGDGTTTAGFFEQFSLQTSDVGSTGSRYDFCVHDALGNLASAESGSFYAGYQYPPGTAFLTQAAFWQHLVGVCDQSNGVISLYVNGLLAATGSIGKTNGIMSTPVPVSIGSKQQENTAGIYDGQLNGSVDDVAIYNYALSSNQVMNHFFATGIAPIITLQPNTGGGIQAGTTNAPQGSSVTLSALAFGSPTLQYQWYDYNNGGTPIAVNTTAEPGSTGSTGPVLTLINVSSSGPNTIGTGVFFVKISNAYGSSNSAPVTILTGTGPVIINPPLASPSYAVVGQSAVFTVGVSGSFPQTNAWYFNNGSTTVLLPNSGRYTITAGTSPTLVISGVTASDAGTYTIFVTNAVSFPTPVSSSSALTVEFEPTFNGNGTGWSLINGTGGTASISGNQLQLTTAGGGGQVAGFWYKTPVYVGGFQAYFTYTPTAPGTAADGTCFVIQNSAAGTTALGGGGGTLGINGITPSVEFELSLYSAGLYGFDTNGASVEVGGPSFTLAESPGGAGARAANGDPKNVTLTYMGGELSIIVSNTVTANVGFTNLNVGDITQVLGTNLAIIGFTGSTGGSDATQVVGNFSYLPLPSLSAAASGSSVVLIWPTGIGGYVLQSCTNLIGTYTNVTSAPTLVKGNNQLTVPKSTTAAFFRLFVP